MKKLSKSLMLMLLTSAFLMFACGGDDEAPKKQFSVEGESYELSNGYTFLTNEVEDEDGNAVYVHAVYLTGKDLEFDQSGDGIEAIGNDDVFAFALVSGSDDEIEEGTYEFSADVNAGIIAQVLIYLNYEQEEGESATYDGIYGATAATGEGTIKVSKSGDKYTFKINITEFQTEDEEGDTVTGEGSIKGYFKGELEVISPSETRQPKGSKNPLTEVLNF